MTLGTTIRALREARGWSQGQLEVHSGVRQTQLSAIERGVHETVNARTLAKIAQALQVSADYLLRQAGWLEDHIELEEPTPAEQFLIDTIRDVETQSIRDKLIEQFTWIAEVARDADLARRPALKLIAEEDEGYGEKE